MRTIGLTLISVFLLAALSNAQSAPSPRFNIFGGYSFYDTNVSPVDRGGTYGWEGSLEARAYRWVGLVADIDTHYGAQNFPICQVFPVTGYTCSVFRANFIERNFIFGPRISLTRGNFRPFVQVLVGDAHVNAGRFAHQDDSFAAAAGGGVDITVTRRLAWRFQADYVRTQFFSARQDNVRGSTGLVFRF